MSLVLNNRAQIFLQIFCYHTNMFQDREQVYFFKMYEKWLNVWNMHVVIWQSTSIMGVNSTDIYLVIYDTLIISCKMIYSKICYMQ